MRSLMLVLVGLSCFAVQAEVYKWIDENGKVHYSDEPKNGAKVVKLKEKTQNQITLPPPVALNVNTDSDKAKAENYNYQLNIQSPEQDATIRNNQGKITVISQIEPKLMKSHFLVLFMDDIRVSEPQTKGIFQLDNIDRGAHILMVKAIDQNGKVLASSQSKQVFLHRARVGQASNIPAKKAN